MEQLAHRSSESSWPGNYGLIHVLKPTNAEWILQISQSWEFWIICVAFNMLGLILLHSTTLVPFRLLFWLHFGFLRILRISDLWGCNWPNDRFTFCLQWWILLAFSCTEAASSHVPIQVHSMPRKSENLNLKALDLSWKLSSHLLVPCIS